MIHKFIVYAVLFVIYCLLSGLAFGVPAEAYFTYEFVRYDGALLLMVFLSFSVYFVKFSIREKTLNYTAFFISFLATVILLFEYSKLPLYNSHNAVGGAAMVLLCLVLYILFWTNNQNPLWKKLLLLTPIVLLLIQSHSRGSQIPIILLFVILVLRKIGFSVNIKTFFILFVIASALFLGVSYYLWLSWGSPSFLSVVELNQYPELAESINLSRSNTIIHRFFVLYPMGVSNFIDNILFGVGFTRYNDFWHGSLVMADIHSHNSFLQIASETGLVGVVLFILYICYFCKYIKSYTGDAFLILLCFPVLISSIFEHRLAAAAEMIPFFISCILIVNYKRNRVENSNHPLLAN